MNNDMKGMCLFLGLIGLTYVALLILLAAFTGVKIIKSILFIGAFSSFLVSLGLTKQVKQRVAAFVQSQFVK